MKLLKTLLPLLALLTILSCSKDENDAKLPGIAENKNKNLTSVYPEAARLEFPKLKGNQSIVLVHRTIDQYGVNFCTEWDTQKKSQRWSCYQMHPGNSSSKTDRKPYNEGGEFSEYPNDPDLSSKYHFTSDPYRFSGYDHGHIIASADRAYSFNKRANTQTFYMTNMQPQINGFNAKVWANMEAQVRRWNNNSFRDTLYVVKGGTIDRWDQIITTIGSGQNKIPVPKYFFMALLCKKKTNNTNSTTGGYRALGFWIQHKSNVSSDLSPYVVNIDELERLTGIDFFCNLPDQYEQIVESLSREQVLRAWNLE